MTPAQVIRRRKTIDNQLEKWYNAEKELQSICQHPNVIKKYESDTGNWCRSDDSYWIRYHCPDCDKRWTVDQ
jgi:hypothetical protein